MNCFSVPSLPSLLFFYILNVLVRPAQALTLIDWTPQKTSAFAQSAADKRCSFLAARFVLQALLASLNKFPVSKHGHYIMTYTVVEEPLLTTSKCNYSLFTEHKYIN